MSRPPGAQAAALARVRLVASDVDGTLLDDAHRVPVATREAIARVQRRGVTVLLATSRGPAALRAVLDDLGTVDGEYFVASQGAVIGSYRAERGLELVDRRPMPLDAAHQVTAAATERGLGVSWFVGDRWLASAMDACTRRESGVVRAAPVVTDLLGEREPPEKVLVMTPPERVHLLAEITAGLPPELSAQVSNPTYLEVTARGVDKGAAVATLAARLGLSPAEVLAIGDGPNDLSMLAYAGVSAAPANARPEVLAAADLVVPSNLEDGVGWVLDAIRPPERE